MVESSVVDRLADAIDDLGGSRHARRALQGHAHREDALNDPIMEVAGDPVPVVQEADEAHRLVQPGVLDGDAGGLRQRFGHGFVLLVEALPAHLVGQVEIPVDLAAHPQGHAQE